MRRMQRVPRGAPVWPWCGGQVPAGGMLSSVPCAQVQGGVYYRFAGPLLINANP